jgi:hypothetical protein
MFAFACCVAVMLAGTAPEPEPVETAPIDQIVAAYGGADLWMEVESIRQEGRVSPTMRSRGGLLLREFKRPDSLRVTIDYGSYVDERVVSGNRGTQDGEKVDGPELQAMILQAVRMDIPTILLTHRKDVVDRGGVKRGNARYRRLEIPLPDALTLILDVDPSSWRVVRSAGILRLPDGSTMAFETDYSEFRFVEGRLFAFREVSIAGGTVTGETLIENVIVTPSGTHP